MNKTLLGIIGILCLTSLAAFYIWSSHNRYYIMTGAQGAAYEVDRVTGESWMLYGNRKVRQEGGDHPPSSEEELPYAATSKITGNAGLSGYGSFSGKLYNGSDWTVTRVIVSVDAKQKDGTVRWSRDFSKTVIIKPLSTETFSVDVVGDDGIKEASWGIKKVFGYKE
jgi:hypothetical protein